MLSQESGALAKQEETQMGKHVVVGRGAVGNGLAVALL